MTFSRRIFTRSKLGIIKIIRKICYDVTVVPTGSHGSFWFRSSSGRFIFFCQEPSMFSSLSMYVWSSPDGQEGDQHADLSQLDDSRTAEDDWVWVDKRRGDSEELPEKHRNAGNSGMAEVSEKTSLELLFDEQDNTGQQAFLCKDATSENPSEKTSLQNLFDESKFDKRGTDTEIVTGSSPGDIGERSSLDILFNESALNSPAEKGSSEISQKTSLEMLFDEHEPHLSSNVKPETSAQEMASNKSGDAVRKLPSSRAGTSSEESMETSETILTQRMCVTRSQKRLMLQKQMGMEPAPAREKRPRKHGRDAGPSLRERSRKEYKSNQKSRGGRKKHKAGTRRLRGSSGRHHPG